MEGPRGHRGTYREPAIVNLVAGDDSGCSLDPLLPSKEVVDGHGVSWGLGAGVSLFKGSQCGFVSIPTRVLSISCGPACLSNPRSMCDDRYPTGERQFIKVRESQLSDHERWKYDS